MKKEEKSTLFFRKLEPEERQLSWALLSDGRDIFLSRWSPSQYAYVTADLLPIRNSYKTIQYTADVLGIKTIIDLKARITEEAEETSD